MTDSTVIMLNTSSFFSIANLLIRSSFVVLFSSSMLCISIGFPFALSLTASPSLHDHYSLHHYYGRLRLPYFHLSSLVVFPLALLIFTSLQKKKKYGSPRFLCLSLQTRQRPRPRWEMSFGICQKISRCLLLATVLTASSPTRKRLSRLTRSPFGFGLFTSLSTLRRCHYFQPRKTH